MHPIRNLPLPSRQRLQLLHAVMQARRRVGFALSFPRHRCSVLRFKAMEVTLHIPDDVAKRLCATGTDISRRALEALALEGYREQTLTLFQIAEMLGFSRVETEDFLGRHQVPLSNIGPADLDREAEIFEAASRRRPANIFRA